ncbi:VOC family protein [Zhongshania aliphaticivorans]|uniref:VOC family protein n=1 Tax=Zhongshania aliphaticivorans TaxID=1470434 RepID=UPI00190F25AD|nr:VOC family protein [Zhongshania aliphaticivorans]
MIESKKIAAWKVFCEAGLGMHCDTDRDDFLAFALDEHRRRLIIKRGPAEDYRAVGYQLASKLELEEIRRRLAAHKIEVAEGSAKEAQERGVTAFWRFEGPKSLAIELFIDAEHRTDPLSMHTSAFVTGNGGMGHMAITSRRPEEMQRFWQEIFDARLSDYIDERIAGVDLDLAFFRLNSRHHSVAIASTRGIQMDPIRSKVQHVNFQVATLEDLSSAFRRLQDLGFEMAHEIGQHPNDKELSFYVFSPSGFEMELGWAPLEVDEATWDVTKYHGMSTWGHKPEKRGMRHFLLTNFTNLTQGTKSLLRSEFNPLVEEK